MDGRISQLALFRVWEEIIPLEHAVYIFMCCEWWNGYFEVLDVQVINRS